MRKKKTFLFFTLVFFLTIAFLQSLAQAEEKKPAKNIPNESLAAGIDLGSLISMAFQNNPRLKAAKLKWEAVVEKYPQVTAYEDPVLQYTRFIQPVETRVGPQKQSIAFSQKIPFPGKLSLKGDIVSREAQMARLNFEKETRNLIVELKDVYYELAYIIKAIDITKENKKLVEHLAKIGTTDYSVDGTTLNDVFKAQSQLAQISYDLILLTEFLEVEKTRINAILNRQPEEPLGSPKELPFIPLVQSVKELYELATANQQELAISDVEIEKREKALSLARMEYLPNFSLGFKFLDMGEAAPGANGSRPGDSGKDAYGVNVGVTIPLWFGKNRARVAEAKLRHEGAVHLKKDLENQTFFAIKRIYFKIQNSQRLVRLYQDSLIPQAQQSMETAETWYKEKKGSFSGLLETQAVWLNFNLAYYRALTDYHQRLALLEKVLGISLEHKVLRSRDQKVEQ